MDLIISLQRQFQQDMDSVKRGGKAIKIRQCIDNLADDIGLHYLPYDGVYNIVCLTLGDVSKTHFKTVVCKTWRLQMDEDKTKWIMVNKPIK